MDQPDHTRERALLMRLLTPSRLRENEEFIGLLADQQLDPIISAGHCEFIHEYASPLATNFFRQEKSLHDHGDVRGRAL